MFVSCRSAAAARDPVDPAARNLPQRSGAVPERADARQELRRAPTRIVGTVIDRQGVHGQTDGPEAIEGARQVERTGDDEERSIAALAREPRGFHRVLARVERMILDD